MREGLTLPDMMLPPAPLNPQLLPPRTPLARLPQGASPPFFKKGTRSTPLPSAAAPGLLEGLGPLLSPERGDVWNFHILSGLWQETPDADEKQ